jgi:SAM-dependent methyltransferase
LHAEVYAFVQGYSTVEPIKVLDIGGRDVNGTCRALFPHASYTVLDALPGPNVDIVANAATWHPDGFWDLILCTEVFEHTPDWRGICEMAYAACKPGGRFLISCASGDRLPHSAIDEQPIRPEEHYANVDATELGEVLSAVGWQDLELRLIRGGLDLQATAVKGGP